MSQKSEHHAQLEKRSSKLHRDELVTGWIRYEKLRRLSPKDYAELHAKNLRGEGMFDQLVDTL